MLPNWFDKISSSTIISIILSKTYYQNDFLTHLCIKEENLKMSHIELIL